MTGWDGSFPVVGCGTVLSRFGPGGVVIGGVVGGGVLSLFCAIAAVAHPLVSKRLGRSSATRRRRAPRLDGQQRDEGSTNIIYFSELINMTPARTILASPRH